MEVSQITEQAPGTAGTHTVVAVVLEHFRTDTADCADWLSPATTQLEHFDVHKTYGH